MLDLLKPVAESCTVLYLLGMTCTSLLPWQGLFICLHVFQSCKLVKTWILAFNATFPSTYRALYRLQGQRRSRLSR